MKRFLIFTVLFPPLAALVFNAPDLLANRTAPDLLWWMTGGAYIVAIIPAWVMAVVDWAFSAKPPYVRILGTAATGALIAELLASFFWNGLREFFPAVMAALVVALPAAVCSWLSGPYDTKEVAN